MNDVMVRCVGLKSPPWLKRVPRFCRRVLDLVGIDGWEVSLLLCDSNTMKELNQRYRGVCGATDILSFEQGDNPFVPGNSIPAGTDPLPAGDIVIALDIMKSQASEFGVSEEEEFKRLLVHGILHLLGYSDDTPEGQREMMHTQQEILSRGGNDE